jgi:tRNA U34 5-methylaminomethyl-2-thiouridine-forming methyltransferase MnmC
MDLFSLEPLNKALISHAHSNVWSNEVVLFKNTQSLVGLALLITPQSASQRIGLLENILYAFQIRILMTSNLMPFVTADGSLSFRNLAFDEMYHTKSGALEEAFEKHAKPLRVWEKENPVIYDVCFGLGYNAAAAIDVIREHGNDSLITVYCLENDREIMEKILEIDAKFKCFNILKIFISNFLSQEKPHYEDTFDNVRLIMIFGDARNMITAVKEKADFVFFDPFSPTHHSEMWDKEFMKLIYDKMNVGGKLTTYSYARKVRDDFTAAGFKVIPGPIIGRYSPSTIAIKEQYT